MMRCPLGAGRLFYLAGETDIHVEEENGRGRFSALFQEENDHVGFREEPEQC